MFKALIARYHRSCAPRRAARGQSFVEFALVLPFLLIVVAGVLEVGNTLTIYNRVQLAAREGARFAAAGGADVEEIIDQASRESLEMDEDVLTVWVIRPTINAENTDADPEPEVWEWENGGTTDWGVTEDCIFGDLCDVNTPSPVRPDRVLEEVAKAETQREPAEIDGTTFAVVVVYYEVDTILNLPFWRAEGTTGEGRIPVTAFGIMAQEVDTEAIAMLSSGCSVYSLLIERSHLVGLQEHDDFWLEVNQVYGSGPYDQFGFVGWRFSEPAPVGNGEAHVNPSYVHSNDQTNTPGSMWFPGTINDPLLGFLEYDDVPEDDTSLHRGDWVIANQSKVAESNQPIKDHSASRGAGRVIRIMLYNYEPGVNPGMYQHTYGHPNEPNLGPELWQYRVDDFALVRILDWDESGERIHFEFIRFDDSCGYDITE